jgi:hypothetical protein
MQRTHLPQKLVNSRAYKYLNTFCRQQLPHFKNQFEPLACRCLSKFQFRAVTMNIKRCLKPKLALVRMFSQKMFVFLTESKSIILILIMSKKRGSLLNRFRNLNFVCKV